MLLKILISYLIGYVRISVEGYYIERFINLCRKKKIIIWNLKRNKEVILYLNTGIKDFKRIGKIAKQTKCKIRIKSKRGLPFIFEKYKKRRIFFIFLIIIIFVFSISSNFIWNIDIIVNDDNKECEEEVLQNIREDLLESGLKAGKLKSKINSKEIINKIRLKRNDIAWLGIEVKGTNAIVKIVKNSAKPDIINEEDYCSIVSNKRGIITKINAQNGTMAVNVGDTVDIGTTLINGWMEGKFTGIRYVHAKGNIEAKVWYTKNKKIPYNTTEKQDTGKIETKYKIKINNFVINLSKTLSKFKIYDTMYAEKKIKLFSNFYLPISVVKITNKEQEEIQKTYSVESAKELGIKELQEELDNEIENKEKIVNKIINTYEKDDGVEIAITYEVLESIGTNEKIIF